MIQGHWGMPFGCAPDEASVQRPAPSMERSSGPTSRRLRAFAADIMIPPSAWADFTSHGKPSEARVLEFAATQGIAPGVVVGRLQHERIVPFGQMNDLKVPLAWA